MGLATDSLDNFKKAIDGGNTNTVFAIHDDNKFVAYWRFETLVWRTADE